MPQYWLKPLGVTQPHTPMPNAWTVGAKERVQDEGRIDGWLVGALPAR
jgi:hypothetical protein